VEIKYGLDNVKNFKVGGYATGSYSNHCCQCEKEFMGDKRAITCIECVDSNLQRLSYENVRLKSILNEVEQVVDKEDYKNNTQIEELKSLYKTHIDKKRHPILKSIIIHSITAVVVLLGCIIIFKVL